jgi:hypothetical protein
MPKEHLIPAIDTLVALLVYFVFASVVGGARGKYKVPAPATTGHPDFERRYRVQQNTLEQLVIFLPSLWIFALTISPLWAGALGGVWILGRIVYAVGYYSAAEKRGPGFGITALATLSLLLGSLGALVLQLVRG